MSLPSQENLHYHGQLKDAEDLTCTDGLEGVCSVSAAIPQPGLAICGKSKGP